MMLHSLDMRNNNITNHMHTKYMYNVCVLHVVQSYATNDKISEEEKFNGFANGFNQNIKKLFIV